MGGLPDALFVIDVGYPQDRDHRGEEARHPDRRASSTPTIRPTASHYVIPGNDDSSRAIRLYARGVADAILEGRSQVDPGDRGQPARNSSRSTKRDDAVSGQPQDRDGAADRRV